MNKTPDISWPWGRYFGDKFWCLWQCQRRTMANCTRWMTPCTSSRRAHGSAFPPTWSCTKPYQTSPGGMCFPMFSYRRWPGGQWWTLWSLSWYLSGVKVESSLSPLKLHGRHSRGLRAIVPEGQFRSDWVRFLFVHGANWMCYCEAWACPAFWKFGDGMSTNVLFPSSHWWYERHERQLEDWPRWTRMISRNRGTCGTHDIMGCELAALSVASALCPRHPKP